jgi:hypothetical protein
MGARGTARLGIGRCAGEAEVEDLHAAVSRDEQVLRLEISVDDALRVRRGQALQHLPAVIDRLRGRERASIEDLAQRLTLEQLQHHEHRALVPADVVDRQDVRMGEPGDDPRFALESGHRVGERHDARRQELDRDQPAQPEVTRPIDLAHPACPERREDFAGAELRARGQCHV